MKSSNNFDIIRLVAAILVIISHQYSFYGQYDPLARLTKGELNIGTFGVYVFFCISGYLIVRSWTRNPNVIEYLKNRVLRIFPGLLFMLLLTVFIIGPIFTNHSVSAYFASEKTYAYFWNLSLLKLSENLPGVFVKDSVEHIVNAPLWTLIFEFIMYLLVIVFGLIQLFTKKGSIVLALIIIATIVYGSFAIPEDLYVFKIGVKNFVTFLPYFFVGGLFYLYQDKISLKWYVLLALMIMWVLSIGSHFFFFMSITFVNYLVFTLAFKLKRTGVFITKHGDFSYGFYIYGFIIQNIVFFTLGDTVGLYAAMAISVLGTAPFAVFSWKFIESKALKLKKLNSR